MGRFWGHKAARWGDSPTRQVGAASAREGWRCAALRVPCAGGVEKCVSSRCAQDAPSSQGCILLKHALGEVWGGGGGGGECALPGNKSSFFPQRFSHAHALLWSRTTRLISGS